MEDVSETYCSIEQELWTACSLECLQERYLDPTCKKEAEVSICMSCLVGEGMGFEQTWMAVYHICWKHGTEVDLILP